MTALRGAFGAGFAAVGLEAWVRPLDAEARPLDAEGRLAGLAERTGLRASCVRFFGDLRLEEVRAFTARRNFAMPGG